MTTATRRGVLAVVAAVILLALGAGVGVAVDDALGIRTGPATPMRSVATSAADVTAPTTPPPAAGASGDASGRAGTAAAPPQVATLDVPTAERVGVAIDERLDVVSSASSAEGELGTLRLLDAYRVMSLHQGQRHGTLSPEEHAAWDADRVSYEALAEMHLEAHEGNADFPAFNFTAAQLGAERAEREMTMAWLARVLLVLAVAWMVIGMLAARTRLVRRPGAAAARVSWIASMRPWRARESTLGMLDLDRWLLLVIPTALLVATRAVETSVLSWTHLAVVLGAWLVFAVVVRVCVGRRSPWPVIAAVGGVVVLRCIVALIALSFAGPGGFWLAFWTDPVLRSVYVAVSFALFVWAFVAGGWALAAQVGARRATGFVLAGVGAGLAVPALVIGAIGLETALSAWNDEIGPLPWGLARFLGITTYLEIPAETPWVAAAAGAVVLGIGVLLALPWRRRGAAASV